MGLSKQRSSSSYNNVPICLTIFVTVACFYLPSVAGKHVYKSKQQGSSSSSCNMYDGSWVYDESYPLYDSSSCPYIRGEFNCKKYGSPNLRYLNYRWQPSNCDLPRFDGKKFLEQMKGKQIMFVGDSLSADHCESLLCLLHASVPNSNAIQSVDDPVTTVLFQDYNVSVSVFHSLFLVDVENKTIGRVLNLDSLKNGENWKKNDVLIFNTWHWWYRSGASQPWDYIEDDKKIMKDMDRMVAFSKALRTWANWIDSDVNTQTTKVFFQGISPSHYNGTDWNEPGVTNCAKETEPISGSSYPGGLPEAAIVVKQVLSKMTKPVHLLDITTLSQLRKDGHPSSYNKYKGMDCTHWCIAGVTDTWNQLLHASLVLD
ncbi:Trichome birefringence-like family [Heracleum sosnowskyi]|uniref:Trichome birefringence-like family n=1 Tax=Heracleum sosnowskyi TaxID=360622 RepID=A0AAD8H4U7_9APIA|nr:Trichome birefringence-like family [Heracleum sosnowskyi]